MTQPLSEMGSTPEASAARPRPFRVNLAANGIGAIVTSIIQFLLVPLYLRQMGVEAYGLIGVQATLWTIVQLADLGVSTAVNRELARRTTVGSDPRDVRDMVRTLEVGYIAAGVLIGLCLLLVAPFADRWLRHDQLSSEAVRHAVQATAFFIAAQWPLSFYQSALLGLQRHGLFNSIRIGMAMLTAVGAYVVLTRVSNTPAALFLWQAATAVCQVSLLAVCTWKSLPRDDHRPRVRRAAIAGLWRVAAGMFGVTATALILSQADRVVATRVLSLQTFGSYMLGAALANAMLYTFNGPVYTSVFPRLASIAARGDVAELRRAYQRDWALMAAAGVPAAAAISVFAQPLLLAWTRDADAARIAAPIAVILIVGMTLNGLGAITLALLQARNWMTLAAALNAGLCALAFPALWLLGVRFGALGVAVVWPSVNLCYVIVGLAVAHVRLGPSPNRYWLLRDVGVPAAAAVALVMVWAAWVPVPSGFVYAVAAIGSAWVLAVVTFVSLSPPMYHSARLVIANLTTGTRESAR